MAGCRAPRSVAPEWPPEFTPDRQRLLVKAHERLTATLARDGACSRPPLSGIRRATEQIVAASALRRDGGAHLELCARSFRLSPLAGGRVETPEAIFIGFGDLPSDPASARGEAVRRILVERSLWLAAREDSEWRLGDAA